MNASTTTSRTDELTGSFFIGSEDVHGTQGELRGVNPRTGEKLEPVYGLGGAEDADRAAKLAAEAFPAFRATDAETRRLPGAYCHGNRGHQDAVVERVVAETGIAQPRVEGELARTTNRSSSTNFMIDL